MFSFVDICSESGDGYTDYFWPKPIDEKTLSKPQPKLSYVKLFNEWNWIIGTGVYLEDLEVDAQKLVDNILEELKVAFSKVKFAESGYMFVFDGGKKHSYSSDTYRNQRLVYHLIL